VDAEVFEMEILEALFLAGRGWGGGHGGVRKWPREAV